MSLLDHLRYSDVLPDEQSAEAGLFLQRRYRDGGQWNCASSVEPVSALTLELPPWITVVTSSK